MIAEGRRRSHRLAVDAATPRSWPTPRPAAHRCRCRASPGPARPRPRPTPPMSRRPGCRRRLRASRGAGRGRATATRSPRGNWSCRRRWGPPAPPCRPAPQGPRRDSCENASASGDGCGRRSWISIVIAGLDPAIHRPLQRTISLYRSRQSGLPATIRSIFHSRDQCLMFFSRCRAAWIVSCCSK